MTLRMPGSAPFHLRVTFHANAGEEMLGMKEKSYFITGDGVYDEIWLEPHKWRREVTLSSYHAIETETGGLRRMQTSSDYEPSRIWMLLDSLYNPIPRVFTTKQFHDGSGWKVEHVSSGSLALVRLSKSSSSQRANYTNSYYFMPGSGELAMSNSDNLITIWSDDAVFDGKIVPRGLTIRCVDKDLLTAHVVIEPAGLVDEAKLALPGPAAEPGMTLRPLHWYEVRLPDYSDSWSYMKPSSASSGPEQAFAMIGMMDRKGNFRELEILAGPSPEEARARILHYRGEHGNPATIDGSPGEFQMKWRLM